MGHSPSVRKRDVGSCWFNSGLRARQSIANTCSQSSDHGARIPGERPRPGPQLRVSQFGSVMRNLPVIEDGGSVRPPALSGCRKTTFTELLSFFLHLGSDLSLAGI